MIIWFFPNNFLQYIYFQRHHPSLIIYENEKNELCWLRKDLRAEREDGEL